MITAFRRLTTALLVVIGTSAAVTGTAFAGPGCNLDVPSISCVGSTATSITLRVCAGATGAPAGISIQWEKASDYAIYGWSSDTAPSYCALSLSGVCPTSRFDLAPGECADVTIHASTVADENAGGCGASGCALDLECGTEYVFRVFAHNEGGGGCGRSPFSNALYCSTAPCTPEGECTYTWGYWKTHGPAGCNPSGHENLWPVSSLTVGCLNLSDAELCDILQQSPKACAKGGGPNSGANSVLILQHQLIAAMLNRAAGAVVCAFADQAIADANALLCGKEYDCVGSSTTLGQQMIAVKDVLAAYNDDQCACPVAYSRYGADRAAATAAKPASWGKVKTIYR